MTAEELDKIDQYLTTRLFDHKIRKIKGLLKNNILLGELQDYIGEDWMKYATDRSQVYSAINRARERVHKKWTRFCKNRKTWSRVLHASEEEMHELMARELVTCKKDMERLLITLRILGYLS